MKMLPDLVCLRILSYLDEYQTFLRVLLLCDQTAQLFKDYSWVERRLKKLREGMSWKWITFPEWLPLNSIREQIFKEAFQFDESIESDYPELAKHLWFIQYRTLMSSKHALPLTPEQAALVSPIHYNVMFVKRYIKHLSYSQLHSALVDSEYGLRLCTIFDATRHFLTDPDLTLRVAERDCIEFFEKYKHLVPLE